MQPGAELLYRIFCKPVECGSVERHAGGVGSQRSFLLQRQMDVCRSLVFLDETSNVVPGKAFRLLVSTQCKEHKRQCVGKLVDSWPPGKEAKIKVEGNTYLACRISSWALRTMPSTIRSQA
jgi:hypothetical protein